jgi:hypothetical protein
VKTPLRRKCAVCEIDDARALVDVVLQGARGPRVTVCGTHALMHERTGSRAKSVDELRALVEDRRERVRRAHEIDELAASLTDAFSAERRRKERRAQAAAR